MKRSILLRRGQVQEVSNFLKLGPEYFIKSILLISEKGPVLALVRGDQELHEKKLLRIIGKHRQSLKEEVKEILCGVEAVFIGPMNQTIKIIADATLRDGLYVSGANKQHYHMQGIRPEKDFSAEWYDGGNVPRGFNLTMSAPRGTIYYTTNGADPRVYGTSATNADSSRYTGTPLTLNSTMQVRARAIKGSIG